MGFFSWGLTVEEATLHDYDMIIIRSIHDAPVLCMLPVSDRAALLHWGMENRIARRMYDMFSSLFQKGMEEQRILHKKSIFSRSSTYVCQDMLKHETLMKCVVWRNKTGMSSSN